MGRSMDKALVVGKNLSHHADDLRPSEAISEHRRGGFFNTFPSKTYNLTNTRMSTLESRIEDHLRIRHLSST